jgi:hypothetical protein
MNNDYTVEPALKVLVFRTNIRFKKDLRQVSPVLDKSPGIMRWNVDREDSDKVLRIESLGLQPEDIIHFITRAGYFCEELPE